MIAVLLVGCVPALKDGFGQELTHTGGCGDLFLFAANADDTVMLRFEAKGRVKEATAAGAATTTSLAFPQPGVVLDVEEGAKVSSAMCTDVIANGGPVVRQTWTADSGSGTLVVTPDAGGYGATADLQLVGVTFSDGAALSDLDLSGIPVGWYAG